MRLLAATIVLGFSTALPSGAQELYAIGVANTGPLFRVDPLTGGTTALYPLGFGISDLAGDERGGLWGIGYDGGQALINIDPVDSSMTTSVGITPPEELATLAFHPFTDTFYSSARGQGTNLYEIDPVTGDVSSIGDLGVTLASLAFDNNGRLYGSQGSSLYEINPVTAAAQLLTDQLPVDRFEDLAFDPIDNTLLGLGYDNQYRLYEIDLETIQVTPIGPSVIRPSGLAFTYDTLVSDLFDDFNGDGYISQADLDLVLLNWGATTVPPEWVAVEAFDGIVSQNELDAVLLQWGFGTPPASGAAVPEPGSLALLALSVCGAWGRRKRA